MNESLEKALQKAKHYCAFQERCHREVREKLYSINLKKHEVETLLTQLIEEGYLNEERFAVAFAGGKFRIKQWGKVKIGFELKQRQVSDYCIRNALNTINNTDYNKTFIALANKKLQSLATEKNVFSKKRKVQDYLLQKGYEHRLISGWLKTL